MYHIHIVTGEPDAHAGMAETLRAAGFRVTMGPNSQPADYVLRPNPGTEVSISEGQLKAIRDTISSAEESIRQCQIK